MKVHPKPAGEVLSVPTSERRSIHTVDALLRRYAFEAQRIGRAFGERHGLHHTDIQALVVIMESEQAGEPITPVGLAEALSLSSGATSALIDRLERTGHVRRSRESTDRRRVHLHYTEDAMALAYDFFGPLGRRTERIRSRYTEADLAVVTRFIADMNEAMYEHRRSIETGE
jgi:DNA-binding MarR family transcriptional regulator